MPDQNVPPHRARDDGRRAERPRSGAHSDGERPYAPPPRTPYSDGYDRHAGGRHGADPYGGHRAGDGSATGGHRAGGQRPDPRPTAGHPADRYPDDGYVTDRYPTGGYAADGHPDPYGDSRRGPRWVGPQGGADVQPGRSPSEVLPDLDDDEDDDRRRTGRRRALIALTGTAAVVAGGTALALSPQGAGLIDALLGTGGGDATAPAVTDGSAARPSGQQPSTVRTYTEQNESYMGSRAGEVLKKNSPVTGKSHSGPASAAAETKVTVRTVLAKDPVRHLAQRATFGATPKVLADIEKMGIDAWLRDQLDPDKIAPTPAELRLAELRTLKMSIPQLREQREALDANGVHADDETVWATIARQIWSDRQLFEVMVDFWTDFLHVAAYFEGSRIQRASFETEVIRKHALGNYADMLVAANRHPALLTYLNQAQSSKDKVNENLARENLELYSVGVDGGYTEADVRQAALLQTGRGVREDQYVYRPERHYVGEVRIMGFQHANNSAEGGEAAADAYFRYLALHESTARYVATNLATRFVSDTPPKSLVDRLAKAYTTSKGAIKPVLMSLFSASEFWASVGQKVRRPMEYLVATYRVLGVSPETPAGYQHSNANRTAFAEGLRQIKGKLEELGQFPAGQPTPNGYPDVYVAWTSAGTMVNGWNEAGNILTGNRKMFTYRRPEELVPAPPATAGAYLDALAQRLVFQKLTGDQQKIILEIAGVQAGTKVDATFDGAIVPVARAILASPMHHLR
ncbi:DUF1800 domain-containing protein [Polymorphospora rubra]|uniref:DUF1800 domain-containing protein n=1 Tax=Polymorphospora rubra TaxID=338584 RepID=UPI0033DB6559